MDTTWTAHTAQTNFFEARRKALLARIFDTLFRTSNTMLSLEDVRAHVNVRGQRSIGLQTIQLTYVIGSEGRYSDFDRHFLPRSDKLKQRWSSIDQAMIEAIELPPIDVYKIGDVYFVRDGNHRVSVARQKGQTYIDAHVTELVVDVPISPQISTRDLLLKEEYSDFLEWTNLHDLRPSERIEFSELGGYLELVRHINGHRYYLGQEQHHEIDRDEAVASWYDTVYMPIIEVIRAQHALRFFPHRTEADLYRWIMDHRWYMRERIGCDPGPQSATSEYIELFGHHNFVESVNHMLRNALNHIKMKR